MSQSWAGRGRGRQRGLVGFGIVDGGLSAIPESAERRGHCVRRGRSPNETFRAPSPSGRCTEYTLIAGGVPRRVRSAAAQRLPAAEATVVEAADGAAAAERPVDREAPPTPTTPPTTLATWDDGGEAEGGSLTTLVSRRRGEAGLNYCGVRGGGRRSVSRQVVMYRRYLGGMAPFFSWSHRCVCKTSPP